MPIHDWASMAAWLVWLGRKGREVGLGGMFPRLRIDSQ